MCNGNVAPRRRRGVFVTGKDKQKDTTILDRHNNGAVGADWGRVFCSRSFPPSTSTVRGIRVRQTAHISSEWKLWINLLHQL